jgi:hypothetical protein
MEFKIDKTHIFILGAGSSVDYGLPIWKELSNLIKTKIGNDNDGLYKYRKEIIDWLDKVGDNKKYETIDECIASESVSKDYHSNGHEIENEIFRVVKDIFEESYRDNEAGWVRKLNEGIKNNRGLNIENRIAFINYNYDDVLDKNFLNFDYLPTKHKIFNYKDRLGVLSGTRVSCFYPHGHFLSKYNSPCVYKEKDTIKSRNEEFIDAVSCYESKNHTVSTYNLNEKISLYILGLGNGLMINLNHLNFKNKISNVYVTIKDENLKDWAINFLSEKFEISQAEVKVYKDCCGLIDNCFN